MIEIMEYFDDSDRGDFGSWNDDWTTSEKEVTVYTYYVDSNNYSDGEGGEVTRDLSSEVDIEAEIAVDEQIDITLDKLCDELDAGDYEGLWKHTITVSVSYDPYNSDTDFELGEADINSEFIPENEWEQHGYSLDHFDL